MEDKEDDSWFELLGIDEGRCDGHSETISSHQTLEEAKAKLAEIREDESNEFCDWNIRIRKIAEVQ